MDLSEFIMWSVPACWGVAAIYDWFFWSPKEYVPVGCVLTEEYKWK